jgi:uncharacterized integral membrane protein
MAEGRDAKAIGKLIGLGVLGLVLLLFIAFNNDKVEVDLLVTEVTARLFVVLIFTAAIGVLIGFLLAKVFDRRDRG